MHLDFAQKKSLREVFLAWIVVILGCRLLHQVQSFSFVSENSTLLTAILLLYVPIGIHLFKKQRVEYLDQSLSEAGRAIRDFIFFSAAISPFVFIGNHFYQKFTGHFYHSGVVENLAMLCLTQVVVISLPEEFFFRGYVQGTLNKILGQPWRFWGVSFGPGLLITSFLFAMSHSFISYQWWHVFIFFPALAFGWLRDKTGRIMASILFHAACNIFSQWVAVHYYT